MLKRNYFEKRILKFARPWGFVPISPIASGGFVRFVLQYKDFQTLLLQI